MKIREYETGDYKAISYLLELCGLPICSADELKGFGLLWEEGNQAVGFVWALMNDGASVSIDPFCVHPDFRRKDPKSERSEIAFWLMFSMLVKLEAMGKTRITGDLQETLGGQSFMRIYNAVGMKFIKPEAYIHGNISEIIHNVREGNYGRHDHTNHHYS